MCPCFSLYNSCSSDMLSCLFFFHKILLSQTGLLCQLYLSMFSLISGWWCGQSHLIKSTSVEPLIGQTHLKICSHNQRQQITYREFFSSVAGSPRLSWSLNESFLILLLYMYNTRWNLYLFVY